MILFRALMIVQAMTAPISAPAVFKIRSSILATRWVNKNWLTSIMDEVQKPINATNPILLNFENNAYKKNPKGTNITIFPNKIRIGSIISGLKTAIR